MYKPHDLVRQGEKSSEKWVSENHQYQYEQISLDLKYLIKDF